MNLPQPGAVETVLGPVEPGELGITLTHEHLLIDLAPYIQAPIGASARKIYERPVSQENLGYVRHYSTPSADNARLLDVSVAIEEANMYKQHGGGTMVDATSIGIARDPVGLARISRQTGLHIVMGSSYYVAAFHPPDMDQRSEDSIVDDIVRDVTQGVDGTTIRSGIIGEVGCTWPLTDNERKVVRASGRAQQITGAPLLIHPGRDETAPARIVDILREVGADIAHDHGAPRPHGVPARHALGPGTNGLLPGMGPLRPRGVALPAQSSRRHARRRQAHGRHRLDRVRGLR